MFINILIIYVQSKMVAGIEKSSHIMGVLLLYTAVM
jgi:hypothetical protein